MKAERLKETPEYKDFSRRSPDHLKFIDGVVQMQEKASNKEFLEFWRYLLAEQAELVHELKQENHILKTILNQHLPLTIDDDDDDNDDAAKTSSS